MLYTGQTRMPGGGIVRVQPELKGRGEHLQRENPGIPLDIFEIVSGERCGRAKNDAARPRRHEG